MINKNSNYSRRIFIKTASVGAVAGSMMPTFACSAKKSAQAVKLLDVRPHELMLVVAKIGAGHKDDLGDTRLTELLRVVRENPSQPITLRCPVTTNYSFQNPVELSEPAEERLFYARCDLLILQRMGMAPGVTKPAIEFFQRLYDGVKTANGILYFDEITSDTWKGLEEDGRNYDLGRAMGDRIVIPVRNKQEEIQYKIDSVKVMYEADRLKIRPHHLMCMTCFYGRQDFEPISEDNLFEAIDIIQKTPEIPIELVCGPCQICPPCYNYCPESGHCVSPFTMAVRDELKDLSVLQVLGLKYGDILPARELYTMLYDKIHSQTQICGYGDGMVTSPEWTVCTAGPEPGPEYAKARKAGLGFLYK